MTDWQGSLRKMQTELTETVRYTVFPDQGGLCLNDWLGHSISLSFTGTIQCVACDRMTKKSFNQGYCFPCFRKLAACDQFALSVPRNAIWQRAPAASQTGRKPTVRYRTSFTWRIRPM